MYNHFCSPALGSFTFFLIIIVGIILEHDNQVNTKAITNKYEKEILKILLEDKDYDHQPDMRISKDLIKQISDSYRKIRNTYRFLLGNLFDFNPAEDSVKYDKLSEIDKYMLIRLNQVVKTVYEAYDNYDFASVYRTVLNFMSTELSSFYLDFTKDVLYIEEKDSLARRSIQTVFYETLKSLVCVMTPIIPHTAEEVYGYMPGEKKESVYLERMPKVVKYAKEEEIAHKYSEFMTLRDDVLKALEVARNEKVIGKSLNAKVIFNPTPHVAKLILSLKVNFAQVFIVSSFETVGHEIEGEQYESGVIQVLPAEGECCARCWQIVDHVDEDGLCDRCAAIIKKLKK